MASTIRWMTQPVFKCLLFLVLLAGETFTSFRSSNEGRQDSILVSAAVAASRRVRLTDKIIQHYSWPTAGTFPSTDVSGVILYTYHPSQEDNLLKSLSLLEQHFNCRFHYPVVIMWDNIHKRMYRQGLDFIATLIRRSRCSPIYQLNVGEHFQVPPNVNTGKMEHHMKTVINMPASYRSMCRFWSGVVYTLPELAQYRYYWRLDTDSYLLQHVFEDPFRKMSTEGALYGTRLIMGESNKVIQGLSEAVHEFYYSRLSSPRHDDGDTATDYHSGGGRLGKERGSDQGRTSNKHTQTSAAQARSADTDTDTDADADADTKANDALTRRPSSLMDRPAIYYNNFELGDLQYFRSPLYQAYFNHLDSYAGFHHLRWGDAPVRTFFVDLFVPQNRVLYFNMRYGHRREVYGETSYGLANHFACSRRSQPSYTIHRAPSCDTVRAELMEAEVLESFILPHYIIDEDADEDADTVEPRTRATGMSRGYRERDEL